MSWVYKIGPYPVRKVRIGMGYQIDAQPSVCLHTTEGSTLAGAVGTITNTSYAPHFTVGDNEIVQMRSLDETGSALRAHNNHFIQIEAVGFAGSDLKLNYLTPPTFEPLVALCAFLRDEVGVPLQRPEGWPDQLSPGTWANNNARRQTGKALTERGWFGHVDVPDQGPSWHYDPGSFAYSALFVAVEEGDEDMNLDTYQKGWDAYVAAFKKMKADPGPPKSDKPVWFRHGWQGARFAANAKAG